MEKKVTLSSTGGVSSGTHDYTIDLSSHLPDDEYKYEVLLTGLLYGDGRQGEQNVKSSVLTSYCPFNLVGAGADKSRGAIIFPIGSDRNLYYRLDGGVEYSSTLIMWGYRRIGTNN